VSFGVINNGGLVLGVLGVTVPEISPYSSDLVLQIDDCDEHASNSTIQCIYFVGWYLVVQNSLNF
jgi:hypothetical protein